MPPSPLHVLTFATGSYLRWLVLLHANLRLLALPATELSVCTGDEASRRATRAMGLEVLDFSRSITGQRSNESASPPRQIADRGTQRGGGEQNGAVRLDERLFSRLASLYM